MHLSPRERIGYASLCGLLLFGFGYIGARHLRQPASIVFENSTTHGRGNPAKVDSPVSASIKAAEAPVDGDVVVDVAGAVKNPGVVHMASDARVSNAIHAAGGPTANADLDSINLAARLVDGTQLRVPTKSNGAAVRHGLETRGTRAQTVPPLQIDKSGYFAPVGGTAEYKAGSSSAVSSVAPPTSASPHRSGKKAVGEVDVNTAGLEELQALPGVGAATAQKILDYRQSHGPFKSVDELMGVKGIGQKKLDKMRAFVRL